MMGTLTEPGPVLSLEPRALLCDRGPQKLEGMPPTWCFFALSLNIARTCERAGASVRGSY